ncbi:MULTISPECIES: hypothetical protein [Gemella]|uniref:hypothetical protein n=1 Tax=Gemella TaxID=1378 RepID=UPI000ADA58A4|nr:MULTISPECIES: hypothetical protein [Gemella]
MSNIEIKNINKTFFPNTNRAQHALIDVNLTINNGDFITILGETEPENQRFLMLLQVRFYWIAVKF